MKSVKSVWVVSAGCYSDYRVLGVFEDEKTASMWCTELAADEESYRRDARVEQLPFVETETIPFKVTTFAKYADLMDDGSIVDERAWATTNWAIDCYEGLPPIRPHVRYVRAPCHNNRGGRLEVRGDSEQAVARTFSEKVNMWKAGSFGGPGVPEMVERS